MFHPFVLSGCVSDLLLYFGNKRFRVYKHCFPWLLVSCKHDHVSFKPPLFLHHVLYFHADSLSISWPKNSFVLLPENCKLVLHFHFFAVVYHNCCSHIVCFLGVPLHFGVVQLLQFALYVCILVIFVRSSGRFGSQASFDNSQFSNLFLGGFILAL